MSINPISTSASALWEFFALDEDNPPPPIKASKEPEIRPLSTSFENRGLVRPTALKKNASFQSLQSIAEHVEANDEIMALKKSLEEKLIYLTEPLPPTTSSEAQRVADSMTRRIREINSLVACIPFITGIGREDSGPISYDQKDCVHRLMGFWKTEKQKIPSSRGSLTSREIRENRHRLSQLDHFITQSSQFIECDNLEDLADPAYTLEWLYDGAEDAKEYLNQEMEHIRTKALPRQTMIIETLLAKEMYFDVLQKNNMPLPSMDELHPIVGLKRSSHSMESSPSIRSITRDAAQEFEIGSPLIPTQPQTTLELMESYESSLGFVPFFEESFLESIRQHIQAHSLHTPSIGSMGYIEKKILSDESNICVRADIHGDIQSLTQNLKSFQSRGLLDASFRCAPNCHLVFLGDYMDRGEHSLQVLEILMALKRENPNQVTLIRGNHENVTMNQLYSGMDSNLSELLTSQEKTSLLSTFYKSLPYSVFIGQKEEDGQIEYVMFTHGLFEPTLDPTPMLCNVDEAYGNMEVFPPIPDTSDGQYSLLSQRVKEIRIKADANYPQLIASESSKEKRRQLKLEMAAQKIQSICLKDSRSTITCGIPDAIEQTTTAFNWADVEAHSGISRIEDLGTRNWKLCPEDIKHYMRLISTDKVKVKLLFRGHEHVKQHHEFNGKVVVTTLPVAMLGLYKSYFVDQHDVAYVLTTSAKVKNWLKQPYISNPEDRTTTIHPQYPIKESSI